MNEIQTKISALTGKLMDDYGKGRVIDEIKMFAYPDRNIIIDILEKLTATATTAPTRSKTTFRFCWRILFTT